MAQCLLLLTFGWGAALCHADSAFVGAKACIDCHQTEAQAWQQSDHYQSMQVATSEHVLGDFNNVTFTAGVRSSKFITEQGKYYIETTNNSETMQRFKVRYTFGYFPLQQYLLETEQGRLQAFDVAWDSRPADDGGQRWYQLQDDSVTDPEHPFFWTGYYQNWNSRCAACHSTDLQKHYNADTQSFNTTYQDVNVACEACHGPGQNHIERANNATLDTLGTGLKALPQPLAFHFKEGDAIARPVAKPGEQTLALDTCGACHSRRAELAEPQFGIEYHQQFQLEGINDPLYFNDGAIRDEVFVLGSFLQSKMAQQGVTCTHCHDPHTGKTILPGAQVCATCHRADVFEQASHNNGHKDADCLDCHMPQQVYMQVDARRDHRFHRPDSSQPNSVYPCVACHTDKSQQWLASALDAWPEREEASADILGEWAQVNHGLLNFNNKHVDAANTLITQSAIAPVLKAALLNKLTAFASPLSQASIQYSAQAEDPLLRREAVKAISQLPVKLASELLQKLTKDPVKSVRNEVANVVLAQPQNTYGPAALFASVLDEYKNTLLATQDHPGSNLGLAQVALYEGNVSAASHYYSAALKIEPTNLAGLLSFAEFARQTGDDKQAEKLFKQALQYGADSAAVQFAYGLHLVRAKQLTMALGHLQQAALANDAQAHYAYVYAVALWQLSRQADALQALQNANKRWPGQHNIINTWVTYAYQAKDSSHLRRAYQQLRQTFPADPLVMQLRAVME